MSVTRRCFLQGSIALGGSLLLGQDSALARQEGSGETYPAYLKLAREGKLAERAEQAYEIFAECELCPRKCGANRLDGELGYCRASARVRVYSAHPHYGEEISLSGSKGSGTIFFSHCNLRCVFCQNWSIAHKGKGREISDEALARKMLRLQEMGCHNVNLVTPTHVMPNILSATQIAAKEGLRIPLVYNTSGFERAEMLKLLDGIVDIYLPDMKYMDAHQAAKYSSGASGYPAAGKEGLLEMHRQVGVHRTDDRGMARRGLMIRHLVMPNRVAGTEKFVKWVAKNLPRSTYVNIMPQYHVAYKAYDYPGIARGITRSEFLEAMAWAEEHGLTNLDPRSVFVRDKYLGSR